MQFQGITVEHSDVEVDGNSYERCTFKHCTFVYQGGPLPQFSHCSFEGTFCRLADAAETNPMFMTALFHGGFHTDVERAFTNRHAGSGSHVLSAETATRPPHTSGRPCAR